MTVSAAIKRLLFQQLLFFAADADPYGDQARVRALVSEWQAAAAGGVRMWPLAYRFDVSWISPLQVAIAYEEPDEQIVQLLLLLPQILHVQTAAFMRPAFHEAAG